MYAYVYMYVCMYMKSIKGVYEYMSGLIASIVFVDVA